MRTILDGSYWEVIRGPKRLGVCTWVDMTHRRLATNEQFGQRMVLRDSLFVLLLGIVVHFPGLLTASPQRAIHCAGLQ